MLAKRASAAHCVSMIELGFAQRLERACEGGYPGYYFWTIDLDDVSGSYAKRCRELR
jgi:hypothetical protein